MANTVQCFAHVLVAHSASARMDSNLGRAGSAPRLSRPEAYRTAREIGAELKGHPERFAAIARERSDDPATVATGGEAGCWPVMRLPLALVDALGNVASGEISEVVETSLGFHVVKHSREPRPGIVDAQELAVMYDGSVGRSFHPEARTRPRNEAKRIAQQLRSKAIESPETFAELAAEHSDAPRGRPGDFGAWNVYDYFSDPSAVRLLLDTKVGDVTPVVEDATYGFRIFRRIEPREHKLHGVRLVSVSHNGTEPGRNAAKSKSADILAQLAANPALFDALPEHICTVAHCGERITMADGRSDLPGLESALDLLEVKGVAPHVFEGPHLFAIARRESAGAIDPIQTPNFTLPRPARRTTESATTRELVGYLRYFMGTARRTANLTRPQEERFVQIMDPLISAIEAAPAQEREALFRNTRAEIASAFGQAKADELDAIDRRLQDELMGQLRRPN